MLTAMSAARPTNACSPLSGKSDPCAGPLVHDSLYSTDLPSFWGTDADAEVLRLEDPDEELAGPRRAGDDPFGMLKPFYESLPRRGEILQIDRNCFQASKFTPLSIHDV